MTDVGLGPNGGLLYCFDFLMENLDFLTEALEPLTDEYLVVFDMPGQIELYTHAPALPSLVKYLTVPGSLDMRLCACYLLEATFVVDRAKFFAGTLSAMSAMLMLELPHVNVLSKMDLVKDRVRKRDMERFVAADSDLMAEDPRNVEDETNKKSFGRLNRAVAGLIESFNMVHYLKLDVQNEDSVGAVLSHVDDCIQFHEAQEPREPRDDDDFGEE